MQKGYITKKTSIFVEIFLAVFEMNFNYFFNFLKTLAIT
ncbi:conserved domain protein [Listeria marthii FSL S4-120]|uniref:Conserved domain protein n=1 Tax=Listeria marthii FSL S4-120 TaxID=702457 RepID=A0ABP2K3Z3_9LIST|nr:conserved domain protein [Listeria marthii FSL S4-120]